MLPCSVHIEGESSLWHEVKREHLLSQQPPKVIVCATLCAPGLPRCRVFTVGGPLALPCRHVEEKSGAMQGAYISHMDSEVAYVATIRLQSIGAQEPTSVPSLRPVLVGKEKRQTWSLDSQPTHKHQGNCGPCV